MSDLLQTIITWLNEVSGNNQMIAGAISLWGLSVGSYFARHIPGLIWKFLVRQFTVTMTINSSEYIYGQFIRWYHVTKRSERARTLIAQNVYVEPERSDFDPRRNSDRMLVSAGYGRHYFFFGGRIFRLTRLEKEATGVYLAKEAVSITTVGRSQKLFHRLLTEVNPPSLVQGTRVHRWQRGEWTFIREQPARPLETVIIPKRVREDLLRHLTEFRQEKSWYLGNGVPYRTGIMLHGLSGSGKTSLAMGLCSYLNADLYIMDPNALGTSGGDTALGQLNDRCLVLMEDIDTYRVTQTRSESNAPRMLPSGNAPPEKPGNMSLTESLVEGTESEVTLSALLNAIDGASSSSGRILVATTNHYGRLDPALVRKGRFDKTIELNYVDEEGFHNFFRRFYPDFNIPPDTVFPEDMVASDVQASIFEHRTDPMGALSALTSR